MLFVLADIATTVGLVVVSYLAVKTAIILSIYTLELLNTLGRK